VYRVFYLGHLLRGMGIPDPFCTGEAAVDGSMFADDKEGGWLPMWKDIVDEYFKQRPSIKSFPFRSIADTNIMVGSHADSLIAEAAIKAVQGFDCELAAWETDASVPPKDDRTVSYFDREEPSAAFFHVDYEV